MILLKCTFPMVLLNVGIHIGLCLLEDEEEEVNESDRKLSMHTKLENNKESEYELPDEKWTVNALRDIAYFLRNHKFNEWDRRYYKEKPEDKLIGFHHSFPSPALESLHWKVHESCYRDFYQCIMYLYSIVKLSPFTRNDEMSPILSENSGTNYTLAKKIDDCKKAYINIEKTGLPFDGPRERFQWRTSASYYMCWYTMMGTPALSILGESCGNFANCFDANFSSKNRDPRSDDRISFACAMYSFCPDPCCPIKHISSLSKCYNSNINPCYIENMKGKPSNRQCSFNRKQNQDLKGIIENKWNVTCICKDKGFEWKSQFGICVDINECVTKEHNCDIRAQDCLNLPGSFDCICKWGYQFDNFKKKCVAKAIFVDSNEKLEDHLGKLNIVKCLLTYIGF